MQNINYKFLRNTVSEISETVLHVDANTATTLCDIDNHFMLEKSDRTTIDVFGVTWVTPPSTMTFDNSVILVSTRNRSNFIDHDLSISTKVQPHALTSIDTDLSTIDLIRYTITATQSELLIVDNSEFERIVTALKIGYCLQKVFAKYPIYSTIVVFENGKTQIKTIVDILDHLPIDEKEQFILSLSYATTNIDLTRRICDKILEVHQPKIGVDLLTQEEQISKFLEFSKQLSDDKLELVPDAIIDKIENTEAYHRVLDILDNRGFGISPTQQFNVLQQVGLFAQKKLRKNQSLNQIVYNLSDMGAGKTLMTVESIFLLDLLTADNFSKSVAGETLGSHTVLLPNKNIIAPTLSLISSWVKTFELFYTVSKVSENTYKLEFTHNGILYTSHLYLSGFTIKTRGITVTNKLPEVLKSYHSKDYLIIDEVHQLVSTKGDTMRNKFLAHYPVEKYMTFVLSGTLSNLTTHQWFNLVKFLGIQLPINATVTTPSALESEYKNQIAKTKTNLIKASETIIDEQQRYFDPTAFESDQLTPLQPKMTNLEKVFHMQYSPKIVHIPGLDKHKSIETYLTDPGELDLHIDPQIMSTPNFELFYNIVGPYAVTAQSLQVAEELFGEQKTQHNADVIKTPSELTEEDLEIVKVLHKVANDYRVYKSPLIASKINNAILNLNDGLSKENIYELLTRFAESNEHFLKYLTSLDLNILEKLPESNLLHKPELKDTLKFKILTDILQSEPDETHLIVVNDYTTGLTLSKALGIDYISKSEFANQEGYQDVLDKLFTKQSIIIVPQSMIKSSLDLVQANRLIQYQLNENISDIIQTQNRINRIGQTRETKAYYIATDSIQDSIIQLFLETYKNIKVAHKGIVELFVDLSSQINVVNDYIDKALSSL